MLVELTYKDRSGKLSDFHEIEVEERELSLQERSFIAESNHYEVSLNIKSHVGVDEDENLHKHIDELNIPTKLITITYKETKTEIYE